MKNILNRLLILFTVTGLAFSCDNEDFTGDSELTPVGNTSISVTLPAAPDAFVEKDSTFAFTVTLSEAQIVDVAFYVTQTAGDATMGDDYTVTNRLVIPAYRTSASGTIKVLADDVPEETETFTLTFGTELTGNATVNPVSLSFEILNRTDGDLDLSLSWSTSDVYDPDGGTLVDPRNLADLIFYIENPDGTTYDEADGGSFEELSLAASAPDGVYKVVAGIYAFANITDFTVDLAVDAFQAGVQSVSFVSPGALSTSNCLQDLSYVATITKVGSSYTLAEAIASDFALDNTDAIAGTYTEVIDDGSPQTATVTMTAPDADGIFTITNFAVSTAYWCGHTGATMDLKLEGSDVVLATGGVGTRQPMGVIDNICGYSGPQVALLSVGHWDPCTGIITIRMQIRVDLGSFGSVDLTYTPQ